MRMLLLRQFRHPNGAGELVEGDQAVEARVAGLVDDTHPALAELLQDLVVTHRPPDHFRSPSSAIQMLPARSARLKTTLSEDKESLAQLASMKWTIDRRAL